MLHLNKISALLLAVFLLVQPVFAQSEPSLPTELDVVSAVHLVAALPSNWSPLSVRTEERQFLLDLTTAPVYTLSADGSWQPVLASALPEDVTAQYAGTFGIPAGAQGGYAYRIQLNPDACWEDGAAITADDYIFSIEKLLEDEENRANWTFLAGAEAILSGENRPGDEIISLREARLFNIHDALAAGYADLYVDTTRFWGLDAGWQNISSRSRLEDLAMPDGMDERFVSPAYLYAHYLADGAESSRFQSNFIGIRKLSGETMTMEDLGIRKTGPLEIVLLLQEPCAPSTLMQKLEKLVLLRKNCWSNYFATSVETYRSYGPYCITSVGEEQIVLEPNPSWWGDPVSRDFDRIICRAEGKD